MRHKEELQQGGPTQYPGSLGMVDAGVSSCGECRLEAVVVTAEMREEGLI
jgi:hypothetical protein